MRNPHDIVTNVLDSDIVISQFELQLLYYVHFWIKETKSN